MSLTWAEAAKTTLDMEPYRDLVGTLSATWHKEAHVNMKVILAYIHDFILSRIYRVAKKLISPRKGKEKIKITLLRT